jgi:hypothetical protein
VSREFIKRGQTLSDLRSLLTQDENGREDYLYPHLEFGDVWWIPDEVTSFSRRKERHPWVIVNGYSPRVVSVIVSPRTSSYRPNDTKRGLLTPANILPGLDKVGLLLLLHRRPFTTVNFSEYEYIGRLPEPWIKQMRDFYKKVAEGKIK